MRTRSWYRHSSRLGRVLVALRSSRQQQHSVRLVTHSQSVDDILDLLNTGVQSVVLPATTPADVLSKVPVCIRVAVVQCRSCHACACLSACTWRATVLASGRQMANPSLPGSRNWRHSPATSRCEQLKGVDFIEHRPQLDIANAGHVLDLGVIEQSLAVLRGTKTSLSISNVTSAETVAALDKLGVESLV